MKDFGEDLRLCDFAGLNLFESIDTFAGSIKRVHEMHVGYTNQSRLKGGQRIDVQ